MFLFHPKHFVRDKTYSILETLKHRNSNSNLLLAEGVLKRASS